MVLLHSAKVSVWGGGRGAAVIQWCLVASLVMRGTEMAQLCNWIEQQVRLMKLNGGESVVGDQGGNGNSGAVGSSGTVLLIM